MNKKIQGKIYKIILNDNYFYFGSTKQKNISQRLQNHKRDSKKKKLLLYVHIEEICGWNNVKIEKKEE